MVEILVCRHTFFVLTLRKRREEWIIWSGTRFWEINPLDAHLRSGNRYTFSYQFRFPVVRPTRRKASHSSSWYVHTASLAGYRHSAPTIASQDFDSDGEKKPKKEDSDDGDGSARNTLKMDQKRSIHFGSHLEDDDDGF